MEDKTVIWIDSREKANDHICDAFVNNDIKYFVSKLFVGDYMSMDNTRLVIERKASFLEIANNLGRDHQRFKEELRRCTNYGIHMIILIEEGSSLDDLKAWVNPYKKKNSRAMSGETIYKILLKYCEYYNVEVQFTTKVNCANRILDLLKAAG